ncbi:MAG: radical SAM protein [Thermoplasmata archaeon]|nr:MAG: radical SAM protein [Thermoplasmata archaeon]
MKSPTEIVSKTIKSLANNPVSKFALEAGNMLVHTGSDNGMSKTDGVMIVLTASDIEMSDFNLNPFIAFSGGFPKFLIQKKLYPSLPNNLNGTTKFAPYGLRKVESLLIEEFGDENVVTVHPNNLHRFIGPKTKIVAISTMDPLGTGFVSRTYTSILGLNGKTATLVEFEDLLSNPALRKYGAKIIVGGAGAWQIPNVNMQEKLDIDTILIGQAEHSIRKIFKDILKDKKLEKVITMTIPKEMEIPLIKKPSIYGTVEIMRGCGRGCAFCSPTLRQRHSFSHEHILKEVELNAKNGTKMIILQTDDIFLYHSKPKFIPNRKAIVNLIQSVNKIEDVEYLQIAHASLAPVVYDKNIVEEIAPALVEKSVWTCNGKPCASIEVGIETGSAQLMKKYMHGKMLPYKSEQWQDVVVKSIETLNDNDIYPLATLILGLPGEQKKDILATVELLDRLKGSKIFYVPLLFTSEEESVLKQQKHKDLKNLDELQWDILSGCWRHNINLWKPEINKTIMFGSMLLYPYFRLKHGKKTLKTIMKFSGLDELLINEKIGVECQPEYCTPDFMNDELVKK